MFSQEIELEEEEGGGPGDVDDPLEDGPLDHYDDYCEDED